MLIIFLCEPESNNDFIWHLFLINTKMCLVFLADHITFMFSMWWLCSNGTQACTLDEYRVRLLADIILEVRPNSDAAIMGA